MRGIGCWLLALSHWLPLLHLGFYQRLSAFHLRQKVFSDLLLCSRGTPPPIRHLGF